MTMRLHLRLDDQDLDRASRASGIAEPAEVLARVPREYAQREARMELLRMGATVGVCSLEAGCGLSSPGAPPAGFPESARGLDSPG